MRLFSGKMAKFNIWQHNAMCVADISDANESRHITLQIIGSPTNMDTDTIFSPLDSFASQLNFGDSLFDSSSNIFEITATENGLNEVEFNDKSDEENLELKAKEGKEKRRRLTMEETRNLNSLYSFNPKPTAQFRPKIAHELHLSPRMVQIWFQNKRAKSKREAGRLGSVQNQWKYSNVTNSGRVPIAPARTQFANSMFQNPRPMNFSIPTRPEILYAVPMMHTSLGSVPEQFDPLSTSLLNDSGIDLSLPMLNSAPFTLRNSKSMSSLVSSQFDKFLEPRRVSMDDSSLQNDIEADLFFDAFTQ